jgi:tight adherence protein B
VREDVALLLVASAALVAAGALIVIPDGGAPNGPRPPVRATPPVALVGGAVTGLVVLGTSGWVVPALVSAIAVGLAIRARRARRPPHDAARTDALASWIENLRDVLLAGDQPIGAIVATVDTCPESIRPEVRRLAVGLGHLDPDVAIRRFADELDDPLGDLVAAGLLIAVRRGARTVDVLSALAAQARSQADRRRLVEAERAPLRREVTLLSVVMGGLVGVLLVFGRADYLQAYDSLEGQLVLVTALVLYAALLLRVQRLAAHPAPRRFLHGRSDGDGQGRDTAGPAPAARGAS